MSRSWMIRKMTTAMTPPTSRSRHDQAAAMRMLRLATRLGDAEDAELRAELAASQVVGIIMVRYVLAFEPVASMSDDELVARVAPVVQFHLTGDHRILDSTPAPAHNSAHDE